MDANHFYYLYILYSKSAKKYYVGSSSNPWIRFERHLNNRSKTYTGKWNDWCLEAVFQGPSKKMVLAAERFIKRQKTKTILERILSGESLFGPLAQLVRVPHLRN